ncbi:MAG TPA: group 1 truncated hemoglobin [Halothiobacillaceae bacterium]|nr:group 1 truncated hemoglobin [Halothiobacillaceae bacterium]
MAVVLGAMSMAATAATESEASKAENTPSEYYYDFGKKAGIKTIIDDFVGVVAADNRINQYFAGANIPRLKMALTNQVCGALGGPCEYKGANMKQVHKGMDVTEAAFNALTEDLMVAMNKHNVPLDAQNHLIKILAPMARPIVTK